MATKQISKKRKCVADGVFYAELNELLQRELAEDGYSGVEVRHTPLRWEIIIRATHPQQVLGEKGQRIRELSSIVQKRFKFSETGVELYAERVQNRGLCAQAQAESLKFKLLGGLAVRRAAYGVVRFVMEQGAKGCEVIVSGKLRAQRAKVMKFKEGYMIKVRPRSRSLQPPPRLLNLAAAPSAARPPCCVLTPRPFIRTPSLPRALSLSPPPRPVPSGICTW